MHSARISHTLFLAVAVGLTACGSDTDNVVLPTIATFRATLVGVNGAALGAVPDGTAQVTVSSNNTISVSVSASGLAGVVHALFLRQGNSCPTIAQDANGDGFIDNTEGQAAYGKVILPLDGNLTDGKMDLTTFPSATSFSYSQTAPLDQVIAAVTAPSQDPIVNPLAAGDSLNLGNRVITVHGVAVAVPGSVESAPGLTAAAALPVLCGRLQLVQ